MSASTPNTEPERDRLLVVAGIIREHDGPRVLLSQRPAHKHQGGCWEFPGGKVEPGESPAQALSRELHEELGIDVQSSTAFMTIDHDYPDLSVRLLFREVMAWSGLPHGREQQPLDWFAPVDLASLRFPKANQPVVTALSLPDQLMITPAVLPGDWSARLQRALDAGVSLVYARLLPQDKAVLAAFVSQCHGAGARVLVADDAALASAVNADGLHLTARAGQWPQDWPGLRSMACHDADQLARAREWQADLVTLSPVQPTPTHAQASPLGWTQFAALASGQPFAVYALGGVGPDDLLQARHSGARGVAGIRRFWE